ncbi:MAG: hypothetical protein U1F77_00330 [Kiritimatiellia bacterium]
MRLRTHPRLVCALAALLGLAGSPAAVPLAPAEPAFLAGLLRGFQLLGAGRSWPAHAA